ncbi:MAG: hypothetical protein HC896_14850 [Bacteroidales bacterium]|nr:hypothetical protein [Bacteroidales bacterium]
MKHLLLVALSTLLALNGCKAPLNNNIQVQNLSCEHTLDPIGIDTKTPRFAWQITSTEKNKSQTAYQVLIATSLNSLQKHNADVFDTKKVASGQQTNVVFDKIDLKSGTAYYWKVRVWDENGLASEFSPPAFFETGLLSPSDWKANWVTSPTVLDWNRYYLQLAEHIKKKRKITYTPEILLSKQFKLSNQVQFARIYISALAFTT